MIKRQPKERLALREVKQQIEKYRFTKTLLTNGASEMETEFKKPRLEEYMK